MERDVVALRGFAEAIEIDLLDDPFRAEDAADARCNAAYPDLEDAFIRLETKLTKTPLRYDTTVLDWAEFQRGIFDSLYDAGAAGRLPFTINKLLAYTQEEADADQKASRERVAMQENERRDALEATSLGREVNARLEGSEGALSREIARDLTLGMYAAVQCADSGQYESLPEALAALDNVRPALRAYGEAGARNAFARCKALPEVAPPSPVMDPVASNVPTLVMGGEYDPITPPSNAALAASTLSNSQLVLIPDGAHGQVDACAIGIQATFLETLKPVDAGCATARQLSFYYGVK